MGGNQGNGTGESTGSGHFAELSANSGVQEY